MKFIKLFVLILIAFFILNGCSKVNKITLMHIHGLGYSKDGKQLFIPAHDGLVVYSDGKWNTMEGKKHDYMGFNIVDDGFYSSGHPEPHAGMKNPLGIVKSTDNGKTIQILDLYGIEDFHSMAVGFKSHTIYVNNSKPNSKLESTGMYYSTDDTKTWNKSAMKGIHSEPFAMAVHSTESAIVAVGTKEGIYLSKDNGNQFELLPLRSPSTALAFGKQGSLWIGGPDSIVEKNGNNYVPYKIPALDQEDAVAFIAQNPVDENEIVFATYKRSVFSSTDKGVSWYELIHLGEAVLKPIKATMNHDSQIETPEASNSTMEPLFSNVEITDCSNLVIPENTELNTSLVKEKGILEVSWYDAAKNADVGYRINYADLNCSESVNKLIKHVLRQ
jgi:photosystem II stability/assembly factor-like uncharacterized protein